VTVRIGTSGWAYADWRDRYFAGVPQRRWYEHVLGDFGTVELNVSFYRLPKAEVFTGWRNRAPAGSVVAVKASRYLTHVKRLREPAEPVARLMSRAVELGPALGPVLVQLPPDLPLDIDALAAVLESFPVHVPVAVEPRHASWWVDDLRRLLERHDAALVWADRKGPISPLWRTASWAYVRFHEGRAEPWPRYGATELAEWTARIGELVGSDPAFVYFNNDPGGAAIDNAFDLIARLRAAGTAVITGPQQDQPSASRTTR
jgi:uncharacterized protein YecE (DUF72 family)